MKEELKSVGMGLGVLFVTCSMAGTFLMLLV